MEGQDRMPLVNPHASALKQDQQLRAQLRWLKAHGFKDAREAYNAELDGKLNKIIETVRHNATRR